MARPATLAESAQKIALRYPLRKSEDKDVIRATVLDGTKKEAASLGDFDFVQLPAPGDRVSITSIAGYIEIWEVQYVEHHPVADKRSPVSRSDPYAKVVVRYLEEFRPPD